MRVKPLRGGPSKAIGSIRKYAKIFCSNLTIRAKENHANRNKKKALHTLF